MGNFSNSNIANFIMLDKKTFDRFVSNNSFLLKGRVVKQYNKTELGITIKDLAELAKLTTNKIVFDGHDQEFVRFIQLYRTNQIFFIWTNQNIYSAAKFIDSYKVQDDRIIRAFKSIPINEFKVDRFYLNPRKKVSNLSKILSDNILKMKLNRKISTQKPLKNNNVKTNSSSKKSCNKRRKLKSIELQNDLKAIEHEILENDYVITEKYKTKEYEKYVNLILTKYGKFVPLMLKDDLHNAVERKMNHYIPIIHKKNYSKFAQLVNDDVICKIELLESISGVNKHFNHNFDQNGVIKKFAFKNNGKIDIIELSVFYCKTCNTYFDFFESFYTQLKKVGVSISSMILKTVNLDNSNFYINEDSLWNQSSQLKNFGYSVGWNGLSKTERQNLLRLLIDSQIMTVYEIKRYLNQFIKYNGKKQGNEMAKLEWQQDLNFLNDYVKIGVENKK